MKSVSRMTCTVLCMLLSLSLVACGSNRVSRAERYEAAKFMPAPPQMPTDEDAAIKLVEAANSVSDSLLELAKVQAAATPPAKGKKLPDPTIHGLTGSASIDWAGPIAPMIDRIAQAAKFKMRILGKEPAIPIIVSVRAKNAPLASILRDVDYQAGNKAHIVVYPNTKVIELRYAANS